MAAKHTLPLNPYVRFPKILRFLFVPRPRWSSLKFQVFPERPNIVTNAHVKKIRMYLFIFVGGEVHYGMKGAYPNNPSRVRNQTLSIQSPVKVLTTRCDEFLGLPRP